MRLAFLADTHADPENEENMATMKTVFAAIEKLDPIPVIHGGEVTEHGTAERYRAYCIDPVLHWRGMSFSIPATAPEGGLR